jgi:hypothetical protein
LGLVCRVVVIHVQLDEFSAGNWKLTL